MVMIVFGKMQDAKCGFLEIRMGLCVFWVCVCFVTLFGGSWHPLSILSYPVSHSHNATPVLPSTPQANTHTLHPYLSLSTLHLLLLAARRWKVNKSCGWGGTLRALICLWSCPVWKRPCVCLCKVVPLHQYAGHAQISRSVKHPKKPLKIHV